MFLPPAVDDGAAHAAGGREGGGEVGDDIGEGHRVKAGEDEGAQFGVAVNLGGMAAAVISAVSGKGFSGG